MLADDVTFIAEVGAGVTDAPGMQPAHELAKLKKKFDIWRKEFKVDRGCVPALRKGLSLTLHHILQLAVYTTGYSVSEDAKEQKKKHLRFGGADQHVGCFHGLDFHLCRTSCAQQRTSCANWSACRLPMVTKYSAGRQWHRYSRNLSQLFSRGCITAVNVKVISWVSVLSVCAWKNYCADPVPA